MKLRIRSLYKPVLALTLVVPSVLPAVSAPVVRQPESRTAAGQAGSMIERLERAVVSLATAEGCGTE